MNQEITALQSTNTWTLVPKPPNANSIANKWIYRTKRRPNGTIECYKAQLVVKGFTQLSSVDYTKTFSPVIKATTIWVIIDIATMNKWPMLQLDVSNSFLYGHLDENLYMAQPQGYVDSTRR